MLTSILASLFLGKAIPLIMDGITPNLLSERVKVDVLNSWKHYAQGNHDVQRALQTACVQTASTIALGIGRDAFRQLKFTPPKLSREFAAMLDERYLKPFCKGDQEQEEALRKQAKGQCKVLAKFFRDYAFEDVSPDDVAALLYNVRFISSDDVLREQTEATKTHLKELLSEDGLDAQFVEFLLFPSDGGGVLYDGIVFHFEEEIKSNERLSKILAHFDRQQILKESQETQKQQATVQSQLTEIQQQLARYAQEGNFGRITEVAQQADTLEQQRKQFEKALELAKRNAIVWKRVDGDLQELRNCFGPISRELSGHLDELQSWLDERLDRDKEDIKAHISNEKQELMRFVRLELQACFKDRDGGDIQITQRDFLSKPYTLWDRYSKVEQVGQGGFSQVWKVRKSDLGTAALKVLHMQHHHDPATIARFLAEGKIMGLLGDTPGRYFAKVRDMGQSADGEFFIEMDFVPGQSLHHILKTQGAFKAHDALRILRHLACALGHAHEARIIHRDLKPANILLDREQHITLIDFGLAKRLDPNSIISSDSNFYGSETCAAPEQFAPGRFGPISERTDVYALGILGYHLLAGHAPFQAKTRDEYIHDHCYGTLPPLPEDLPEAVANLALTCAQKEQKDRLQSMTAVKATIDKIFRDEAIQEYAEVYHPFIGVTTLSARQRNALERHRKQLNLSKDLATAIEAKLRKTHKRTPQIGDTWTEPVTGMEFVWIPPGVFWMGATDADKQIRNWENESPRHKVRIAQGFWMGKYAVTNAQYRSWKPEHDSGRTFEGHSCNDDRQPVVMVSGEEATTFTQWLTQQYGNQQIFRLPSEAEWEYACRAGTESIYFWGNELNDASHYANTGSAVTAQVGSFCPNNWGLHDMLGNVWEWCDDPWHESYEGAPKDGSVWEKYGEINKRLLRGGSWNLDARYLRCACRNWLITFYRNQYYGFRVVLRGVGARTL